MIAGLHRLRRHEEGQALVLACICMLVLSLSLLATVNLTFAAKERVDLQNTADAAAYTTAAVQARALNFFAYTNRAQTVQYAADMNIMAVHLVHALLGAVVGVPPIHRADVRDHRRSYILRHIRW